MYGKNPQNPKTPPPQRKAKHQKWNLNLESTEDPSEVPKEFICEFCNCLPFHPLTCAQGHIFCKECTDQSSMIKCILCDTIAHSRHSTSLYPLPQHFMRHLLSIKVKCRRLCGWSGMFREAENHEILCRFKKNKCELCEDYLSDSEVFEHQNSYCVKGTVECGKCSEKVERGLLYAHSCKKSIIGHLTNNNEKLSKNLGDVKTLLTIHTREVKTENTELKGSNKRLDEDNKQLFEELKQSRTQNMDLVEELDKLKEENRTNRTNSQNSGLRVLELETELSTKSSRIKQLETQIQMSSEKMGSCCLCGHILEKSRICKCCKCMQLVCRQCSHRFKEKKTWKVACEQCLSNCGRCEKPLPPTSQKKEISCNLCKNRICELCIVSCKCTSCSSICCTKCGVFCSLCLCICCPSHIPTAKCNTCSRVVCSTCALSTCTYCEGTLCNGCSRGSCAVCKERVCGECTEQCKGRGSCNKLICTACMRYCQICEDHCCKECALTVHHQHAMECFLYFIGYEHAKRAVPHSPHSLSLSIFWPHQRKRHHMTLYFPGESAFAYNPSSGSYKGYILICGGYREGVALGDTQLIQITPVARVHVVGGKKRGNAISAMSEVGTDEFNVLSTHGGSMEYSRYCHSICGCDKGCFYAIGGFDFHQYLRSVERFDIDSESWVSVGSLSESKFLVSSVQLGVYIYAFGGKLKNGHMTRVIERMNVEEERWKIVDAKRPGDEGGFCSAGAFPLNEGNILIMGGQNLLRPILFTLYEGTSSKDKYVYPREESKGDLGSSGISIEEDPQMNEFPNEIDIVGKMRSLSMPPFQPMFYYGITAAKMGDKQYFGDPYNSTFMLGYMNEGDEKGEMEWKVMESNNLLQ